MTLIELANAYRALANGGEWRPWTWRPVRPARPVAADRRRVVSPVASAIVLDILNDPAARMPGFGFETPFDFPFPVAVKTGTSRHFTDNWAVGTTRGFTVAVWAGNFNGRPMEGVSGVTGAGSAAASRGHGYGAADIRRACSRRPRRRAPVAFRCAVSRACAQRRAAPSSTKWFVRGTEPTREDDWEQGGSHHAARRVCGLGARGTVACHRRASQGRVDSARVASDDVATAHAP